MGRKQHVDVLDLLTQFTAEEPTSQKVPIVAETPKATVSPEVAYELVLAFERLEALRKQSELAHAKATAMGRSPEGRKAGGRGITTKKWLFQGLMEGAERGQQAIRETWAVLLDMKDEDQAEQVMRRLARGGK
jgi:hypothetical protein